MFSLLLGFSFLRIFFVSYLCHFSNISSLNAESDSVLSRSALAKSFVVFFGLTRFRKFLKFHVLSSSSLVASTVSCLRRNLSPLLPLKRASVYRTWSGLSIFKRVAESVAEDAASQLDRKMAAATSSMWFTRIVSFLDRNN